MTLEQYRTRRRHDGYFAGVMGVLILPVLCVGLPTTMQLTGLLILAAVFFVVTFRRLGHDLHHTDPADVMLARAESNESYAAWHFRISTTFVPLLARVTPERSRLLSRCCSGGVFVTLAVIAFNLIQLSKTQSPFSLYVAFGTFASLITLDIVVSGPWRVEQARLNAARHRQKADDLRATA